MRTLLISFVMGVTVWGAAFDSAFAADKNLNVAMVLWRGETAAEQGFREGLAELGYSVQYTTLDAEKDKTKLGRLLRESLLPKATEFDYVYTFGTTVSLATKALLTGRTPQVFNIVSAPLKVGLVDSISTPGGNISGVSNGVPIALQLQSALKMVPVKRLGLMFNPRERNSMANRAALLEASKEFGFEVIDLKSPPVRDALDKNLDKLADGSVVVDAVYLPPDSFLVSNAALIGSRLLAAKVKTIGSIEGFIKKGALVGIVADYYELGRAAASIIDRHQQGETLGAIPVISSLSPTLVVNRSTSTTLDVSVPGELKAKYVD